MKTNATDKHLRVFEYTDYRSYLIAHFEDRKRANPAWSYQAWAKKLGLKNNTSLLKIIHGKREAGPQITSRLVDYFRFNGTERQYFEDLVRLAKNRKDPALQVAIFERLQRAHPKRSFEIFDDQKFRAVSHWWYYAIRQLAKLETFAGDADQVSRLLLNSPPPREIDSAIRTLTKLELLIKDEKTARLRPSPVGISTHDDVASEALKRFHEEVLALAQRALRTIEVRKRQISGLTLTMSEEDLPRAKEFLRRMEDEFCAQFGDPPAGTRAVYQLELALFPLSKPIVQTPPEENAHVQVQ